jgi:16S rRNA (uracil1498-N3)-methyltransferase
LEKDFRVPSDSLTERRIGAIVTARDETGVEYRVRIISIEGATALVHPFEKLTLPSESLLSITLIQALPKRGKMEWIIQKATELGVSAIIPCVSEKGITLAERDRSQPKSHRWQEIVRKATEQSRRRVMPLVGSCVALQEALKTQQACPVPDCA